MLRSGFFNGDERVLISFYSIHWLALNSRNLTRCIILLKYPPVIWKMSDNTRPKFVIECWNILFGVHISLNRNQCTHAIVGNTSQVHHWYTAICFPVIVETQTIGRNLSSLSSADMNFIVLSKDNLSLSKTNRRPLILFGSMLFPVAKPKPYFTIYLRICNFVCIHTISKQSSTNISRRNDTSCCSKSTCGWS